MIKFICPHCRQKLGVPADYAGRRVRCNKCNQPCSVPRDPEPSEAFATVPAPSSMPDTLEEDPNAQILQQVRSQRQAARRPRSSSFRVHEADPVPGDVAPRVSQGGGFCIRDYVPDFLLLPLSLIFCVVLMAAVIGIWLSCSAAASMNLNFFIMLIPLSGALALRFFAVNRTFLLGLLALLLGSGGIVAGKAASARFFVIPLFEKKAAEEVLVDLELLLQDPERQVQPGQSVSFYAKDGVFMGVVGLIVCVEEGSAEPIRARRLALELIKESNRTNLMDYLTSFGGYSTIDSLSDLTEEDEEVLGLAFSKSMEWQMNEESVRVARQYYPALSLLVDQAEIERRMEDPGKTFQHAVMEGIGLFDLIWIMVGLGGAYGLAASD